MKKALFIAVLLWLSLASATFADTLVYGIPGGSISGDITMPSGFYITLSGNTANTVVRTDSSKRLVDSGLLDDGTVLYTTRQVRQMGTTGGIVRYWAEASANITAAASVTITLSVPSGARLIGTQLRVDAALATGELWDAAFSGGSTTSIVSGAAVAKNTKVNSMYDANAASDITSDVTNITITKNGGGSFTAQGTIRAIVYYETFTAMGDAS